MLIPEIWYLFYVITVWDGQAPAEPIPKVYPSQSIAFEPPSDWLGCYHQKRVGLPAKQTLVALKSKKFTVTATCYKMGIESYLIKGK